VLVSLRLLSMIAKDRSFAIPGPVVISEDWEAERAAFDGTLLAALAYGEFGS
jgi:hypothetical protein